MRTTSKQVRANIDLQNLLKIKKKLVFRSTSIFTYLQLQCLTTKETRRQNKTRKEKMFKRQPSTPTSSESSDNMGQNPKDTSTPEMDISDRVVSLPLSDGIRKETQRHVKRLQRLINHPVDIKLFGESHPNTNGIATLIQEHPEHKKELMEH
jgi:hypothetical protein